MLLYHCIYYTVYYIYTNMIRMSIQHIATIMQVRQQVMSDYTVLPIIRNCTLYVVSIFVVSHKQDGEYIIIAVVTIAGFIYIYIYMFITSSFTGFRGYIHIMSYCLQYLLDQYGLKSQMVCYKQ